MNLRIGSLLIIALALSDASALAQSNPTYIQFSPAAVKAALYKPDAPAAAPHVGILVVHRTSNVMGSLACTELSQRGFMVLCLNPRSDNNEALVKWDQVALDVKSGVNFLRKQPGITKVLLLGGSGGGPTMSYYQAVAENGVSYCQAPNKILKCGKELANLPPADGIIFRDARTTRARGFEYGMPEVVTGGMLDVVNGATGFCREFNCTVSKES